MLPNSLSANRFAACSVLLNWYDVVWWIGTAREPVTGSGTWPPCRASVSGRSESDIEWLYTAPGESATMFDTLLDYLRTPLITLSGTPVTTLTLLTAMLIIAIARVTGSVVGRSVDKIFMMRGLDQG